ncbi:hypothetical protein A2154_04555 [Candidatus Gottesmanbacteria bacterium RBG_16_43_7]|uniref:Lactate dehydrogenase n=1 Tax=Candidatus Gottesmanbacteria bacterium RBG_16_43_7 TaxID=1798373 RepID=A0A1F5ZBM2_9BACT|nr:MAG: hypothetical protein A2154_04555 [Candidatus Gottesmanbacteria bacterium RBG_16_43_7]
MKVKVSDLVKIVQSALIKQGYNRKESEVIGGMLMYAQLRGNNQGVVKLIGKGIPKNEQAGDIEIIKDTKLSALINGNGNPGALVMKKAMDLALNKALAHGFGIVGTNHTWTSTGAIGYWAGQIAQKGLIGFVFAGSPETVSTYGSYDPIFGTNPLAIGIPTADEPVVLDMATAAMAYYGLIEAKTAGKKIPPNTAYDKEGQVTQDPGKAMDGAIMPFDRSYKGAGLNLIVEILTGPLVGASFTGIGDTAKNWGNLIFVIDPDLLGGRKQFAKNVTLLIKKVKNTKKLPGVKEIFTPGSRGNRLSKQRLAADQIEIEDNLYRELVKVS